VRLVRKTPTAVPVSRAGHSVGVGTETLPAAARHEVMSSKTTYVQPKPHTGIFLS
jgi:hypothetical protein